MYANGQRWRLAQLARTHSLLLYVSTDALPQLPVFTCQPTKEHGIDGKQASTHAWDGRLPFYEVRISRTILVHNGNNTFFKRGHMHEFRYRYTPCIPYVHVVYPRAHAPV